MCACVCACACNNNLSFAVKKLVGVTKKSASGGLHTKFCSSSSSSSSSEDTSSGSSSDSDSSSSKSAPQKVNKAKKPPPSQWDVKGSLGGAAGIGAAGNVCIGGLGVPKETGSDCRGAVKNVRGEDGGKGWAWWEKQEEEEVQRGGNPCRCRGGRAWRCPHN